MTAWLVDKSALVRIGTSPDAADWATRIERGLVRISTLTRLEVGYSARSAPDLRAGLQRPPLTSMPTEYLTPAIEDRAVQVQLHLADRGQHRAPSIPDLLIARPPNWPASPCSTSTRTSRSSPTSPANPSNASPPPDISTSPTAVTPHRRSPAARNAAGVAPVLPA